MSGAKTPANSSFKKPGSPQQPKVFDIRRPGKALASPTSRPVITPPRVKDSVLTNKPVLSKPSSKPLRIASNPNDERDLMDPTKKVTVQPAKSTTPASVPAKPVSEPHEAEVNMPKPEVAPAISVAASKETARVAATPASAPEPTSNEPSNDPILPHDPNAQTPAVSNNSAASSPLQQLQSDMAATMSQTLSEETPQSQPATPSHEPQNSEEVLAGTAAPEVDMSRAVISTHVTPRRRLWREVLTVIGLLLFVVAVLDVLLDSGIFHVHGIPHTNLWKN